MRWIEFCSQDLCNVPASKTSLLHPSTIPMQRLMTIAIHSCLLGLLGHGIFRCTEQNMNEFMTFEGVPLSDFGMLSWPWAKSHFHLVVQFPWHFREALGGIDPLVFLPLKPCSIKRPNKSIPQLVVEHRFLHGFVYLLLLMSFNVFSFLLARPAFLSCYKHSFLP